MEYLNKNIHYQMFCGIMIDPSFPITSFKIVSAIHNRIATRLDVNSLQMILVSHWKTYLDNLHVCMTDGTCYEKPYAFSYEHETSFGNPRRLYKHIRKHCGELGIRRSRNKYKDVAETYLSYCKKRKIKASRERIFKRRMLKLLFPKRVSLTALGLVSCTFGGIFAFCL